MRRAIIAGAAGLTVATLALTPVLAQDALPPRAVLGGANVDPTGCDKTPELIRRLYIECNLAAGRAVPPPARRREDAAAAARPPTTPSGTPPRPAEPPPAVTGRRAAPTFDAGVNRTERADRTPPEAAPVIAGAGPRETAIPDRRCLDILLRGQLGEEISDADRSYLRGACSARE